MKPVCLLLCVLLLTGCMTSGLDTASSAAAQSSTGEPLCTTEEAISIATEPTAVLPEETFAESYVHVLLASMTLEQRVGQLFLGACPEEHALSDISDYHLGGYILFGKDFEGQTPNSLKDTLSAYQAAANIPLLIAVDEEGGTVCRVSAREAFRSSRFPSVRELYRQGGMEQVLAVESEKCQLLTSLGINVNMAPVCDITTESDAFMYQRSLGESPETTGVFAAAMVALADSFPIGSVLKHFPGYGNNRDTHSGIAVDHRSLDELLSWDLVPFLRGIEAGCGAILVSHTIVECLDPDFPASLSPAVHAFLRDALGFEGVIVTDDLTMGAITELYGSEEAAVLAVLAGNDLLCTFDYRTQYAAVLAAVQNGIIPEARINEAACRVLLWKEQLGLLESSTNFT